MPAGVGHRAGLAGDRDHAHGEVGGVEADPDADLDGDEARPPRQAAAPGRDRWLAEGQRTPRRTPRVPAREGGEVGGHAGHEPKVRTPVPEWIRGLPSPCTGVLYSRRYGYPNLGRDAARRRGETCNCTCRVRLRGPCRDPGLYHRPAVTATPSRPDVLRLHERDNVVVALRSLAAGSRVAVDGRALADRRAGALRPQGGDARHRRRRRRRQVRRGHRPRDRPDRDRRPRARAQRRVGAAAGPEDAR